MQPSVRKALQSLQSIFDEGFMTQEEYDQRRTAIIDGATAVTGKGTEVAPFGQGRSSGDDRGAGASIAPHVLNAVNTWGAATQGAHEMTFLAGGVLFICAIALGVGIDK